MSSDPHVQRLKHEIELLRALIHASSKAQAAETLVKEAEARCEKRLKRARKKLLLASHPDKTASMDRKELSSHFNRAVREIMN